VLSAIIGAGLLFFAYDNEASSLMGTTQYIFLHFLLMGGIVLKTCLGGMAVIFIFALLHAKAYKTLRKYVALWAFVSFISVSLAFYLYRSAEASSLTPKLQFAVTIMSLTFFFTIDKMKLLHPDK
jgi:hypothetical protein